MIDLMRSQMQAKKYFFVLVLIAVGSIFRLEATAYQGISTTNPGPAIYLTSQTAVDGDSYKGFVSFNGGLTIPSTVGGTVTVGTVGRLGGNLNFQGANSERTKLLLTDDLECASDFRTSGFGIIDGGGYTLKLTGSMTLYNAFPGPGAPLYVKGNLVIDGGGNTLTLGGSFNTVLQMDPNVSVTLRNMTLVLAWKFPFQMNASNSLTLDNVDVIMSPTWATYYFAGSLTSADCGQLWINNNVRFSGPGATFFYNSKETLGVAAGATLTFGPQTIFSWYAGYPDRLYLADQTSILRLNNCTFTIPAVAGSGIVTPGLQLKKGMVEFDNRVFVENGGQSNSANGLIFGDGVSTANNVAVNILSDACVIVDGFVYYKQV